MKLCLQNFTYLFFWGMVYSTGVAVSSAQETTKEKFLWHDPKKIVTAKPCNECHQLEYGVWEKTKHSTSFKTLHRKELAERITKNMSFKFIKRESLCLKCHYTGVIKNEQLRAISGVSCESCHGAAKDWIDVHNNYGPGAKYNTESAEHEKQRILESKKKGMLRPSEVYGVVANCFQCHTVPHEKLVNVGGHTSGSRDFDLLARIDTIRHNFLQAQFDPSRSENAERSQEQNRILYVVGKAVDLEYSIRGMAASKETGGYVRAMNRRVRSVVNSLMAIQKRIAIKEVQDMLSLLGDVNIGPNNESALLDVAAKISKATKTFISKNNGSELTALDGVIAGTENLFVVETIDTLEKPESTTTTDQVSIVDKESKPTDETPVVATEKSFAPVYAKKNYIRPRSKFKTILPGCNCHSDQIKWWESDKHFNSAEPFFNKTQKNIQLARNYGLSVLDMTRGDNLCMDCHGTIITDQASEQVFDGVSCESCHGPASGYNKPHQEEGRAYLEGEKFGMVQLENVGIRAEACAQCHYINDPRLISSGHPTGTGRLRGKTFNLVERNQQIKHWKNPIVSAEELEIAYAETKRKRGAIPEVEIVSRRLPTESPKAGSTQPRIADRQNPTEVPPPKPPPIIINHRQLLEQKNIKLPPFPAINDSTSIEEILLILKKRIELLYEQIGRQQ